MNLRACVVAAAWAVGVSVAAAAEPSADFDKWAEAHAAQRMRERPQVATMSQYFDGEDEAQLDGRWAANDRASRLARAAEDRAALPELARFDLAALTPQQRTSAALIGWALQREVDATEFMDDEFPFNQMDGLQVSLPTFMATQQPLRRARDVQSYLERLSGIAARMDAGIELAKTAQAHGVLMPGFIADKSIAQFEHFLADPPARNLLVTSFAERLAQVDGVSADEREAARAKAEKIVADSVLPAFRRGLALLQAQRPKMSDDAGLWRLPGGDKAYAAALRRATTTDYTPQQIHAIGLAEVARIEAQMDRLLRTLGYTEGSVKDRYAKLDADRQPKGDDPRPELLARYTAILRDAQRRAKDMFDLVPAAPVEVRREPALTEATAAAHYTLPAPDGSRPGIFWAPLPGPTYEIAGMRTLVYHEAVPGHHFQIALQQASTALPRYRRKLAFGGGSAFIEGWALYAEQLAAESHWYDGDPVGQLGQLDAALFRARRLVVDTGLHAMKWTRQQAIDYGIPEHEVDRYVVWPGQACAYMIGRLRIEALRDRAREKLGDKFELRKFHDLVLETGDVPLAVLEGVVDSWIRQQQA